MSLHELASFCQMLSIGWTHYGSREMTMGIIFQYKGMYTGTTSTSATMHCWPLFPAPNTKKQTETCKLTHLYIM